MDYPGAAEAPPADSICQPARIDPSFPIKPTQGPHNRSRRQCLPESQGEIRFPIMDSSMPGTVKLTADDVTTLITQSVAMAKVTRAAIRQPIGVPARMQVGVTDLDGTILGVFQNQRRDHVQP